MNKDHQARSFDKLLVIGMSTNVVARATVEDELVYFLRMKGINAIAASSVLPPNRRVVSEPAEVQKQKLIDAGYDGVMAISLLEKKDETKYVQGTGTYAPVTFYGGHYQSLYTYYPHMYSNVYQPGYYVNSQTIILNTSLFNVNDGELLWSAQSKTVDPASLDEFANSYSKSMVTHLLKKEILKSSVR